MFESHYRIDRKKVCGRPDKRFRTSLYEKRVETGREEAVADIRAEARELGADAVVGAAFDYEEMREGMLWVNISGTAVRTR